MENSNLRIFGSLTFVLNNEVVKHCIFYEELSKKKETEKEKECSCNATFNATSDGLSHHFATHGCH